MKNLYKAYETDKKLETNGVKLDFGGPAFFVKRAGGANRKFSSVFSDKIKPYKRAMDAGTLDENISDRILLEVYFETVVMGWENVADRQGALMEFNKENFVKLMTDLPDLWNLLRVEAAEMRNFQAVSAAEDGEALGNESAGS